MHNIRTVSIVAGGWSVLVHPFPSNQVVYMDTDTDVMKRSFATLNDQGLIHVWGKLDGESFVENYGTLGDSGHTQTTPATLKLPEPIVSIRSVDLPTRLPSWYCIVQPLYCMLTHLFHLHPVPAVDTFSPSRQPPNFTSLLPLVARPTLSPSQPTNLPNLPPPHPLSSLKSLLDGT